MIADALQSAFKVLIAGLIFGAGLPAIFAIGVRFWSIGSPEPTAGGQTVRSNPAALAAAVVAFAIVAVAVVLGVLWITQKSIDHYFGITIF
ncbi:hypothetical protein [Calidifontibacter terrae]